MEDWEHHYIGIVEKFGVTEQNINCSAIIDLLGERGLCVGNTFYKHDVKKRYARYGREERNSMIDFVLVRKELLKWVFDVRAAISLSGGDIRSCDGTL